MIYFIASKGAIKIGHSRNPQARLQDLQVGSSKPLELLHTMRGGRGTEAILHDKFKHLNIHGEWFQAGPELLSFILGKKYPFHRKGRVTRSVKGMSEGLRYYRNAMCISQNELSEKAFMRQATISKVESGAGATQLATVYQMCAVLGLELVLRPR